MGGWRERGSVGANQCEMVFVCDALLSSTRLIILPVPVIIVWEGALAFPHTVSALVFLYDSNS